MSSESGVPVFRGPGGLWEGFRPEELATPEAFEADPVRVWRWYRWRLERVSEAQPHDGHRSLVTLEAGAGLEAFTVITQNVDGLHQRAGTRSIVELHGDLSRARCQHRCGHTAPAETVDPENCRCPCGEGRLRPDVVWFGESLDPANLLRAERSLADADMVWVVGTSSVVYPAAILPELAARRGIPVVEVNPDPTPLSERVPYSLRLTASTGLSALARDFRSCPR
jgi:NAD-dependent deacetylase